MLLHSAGPWHAPPLSPAEPTLLHRVFDGGAHAGLQLGYVYATAGGRWGWVVTGRDGVPHGSRVAGSRDEAMAEADAHASAVVRLDRHGYEEEG